jgi:hypothetical protein
MMDSQQPVQPAGQVLLPTFLTSFWLMAVAMCFTAFAGVPTILQGKIRLLFSYWQCLPALIMLISICFIPRKNAPDKCGQRLLMASFAMLTLSPFPTWAARSSGNIYFELCSIAFLAAALWLLMEACQLLRILAESGNQAMLAIAARKTQFLILCFAIIPLSAFYCSGMLGLFTGASHSFQDALRIWNYGKISHFLRVFLYWSLLQFLFLCLSAIWTATRQLKKILKEPHV